MTVDRAVHQLDHIAVAGAPAIVVIVVVGDRIIAADVLITSGTEVIVTDNVVIAEPAVDSIAVI